MRWAGQVLSFPFLQMGRKRSSGMLNDLHTFCTVQQIFIKPLLYVSDTVLGAGRIGKSRDLFKTVLQML